MEVKRVALKFVSFSTMIDPSFWHELSRLKLEKLGLNKEPVEITAFFRHDGNANLPSLVNLNYQSFVPYNNHIVERKSNTNSGDYHILGELTIYNTLEEFNNSDKRKIIIEAGKNIWQALMTTTEDDQQKNVDSNLEYYLARLKMIVFADLKQHKYHYWCAFPSFNYPPSCFQLGTELQRLDSYINNEQIGILLQKFKSLDLVDRLFFAIIIRTDEASGKSSVDIKKFSDFWKHDTIESAQSLSTYEVLFAFHDPCAQAKHLGWLARNYLAYLYVRFAQLVAKYPNSTNVHDFVHKCVFSSYLRLVSFRIQAHNLNQLENNFEPLSQYLVENSSVYPIVFHSFNRPRHSSLSEEGSSSSNVQLSTSPLDTLYCSNENVDTVDNVQQSYETFFDPALVKDSKNEVPPVVGWQRDPEQMNRLVPRFVDCSRQLDPKILSNDAVYLNLKLMKWRLVPQIDLDLMRNTRCLLLGAGTLGCNISRALMAWGITKITFVDNATVSYSNPVRQSLYTYLDCVPQNDGQPKSKAKAAAVSLQSINPSVQSEGIKLSIPMPGHPVAPAMISSVQADVKKLEKLITEHDVIFLLMDTRESRWLPSLIAASQHKIVINVALGFDTYLVQRHGIRFCPDNEFDQKSDLYMQWKDKLELLNFASGATNSNFVMGHKLGCYYCNDVFAPGDTTRDRTLDQQCTVTRPGISMIASGYAVEMLASLLQHPAKSFAPSYWSQSHYSPSSEHANENFADLLAKKLEVSNAKNLFDLDSLLGIVPHQIRGFISRMEQITPTFKAFDKCTACSDIIISKYRKEKFDFLLQVFNNSSILEEITGLKKFHEINFNDIEEFDIDEDCV